MKTINILFVLISCVFLLLPASGLRANTLPNASFELDLCGRDYQVRGEEFLQSSTNAFDGKRCLVFPHVTSRSYYTMISRTIHAEPGQHTFSFHARNMKGLGGTIKVHISANPFVCGVVLPRFEKSFLIDSTEWKCYSTQLELPKSKDDWYYITLYTYPKKGDAVLLDALSLTQGTKLQPFSTTSSVELQMAMPGDFTRIYTNTDPLPPLEIRAYNSTPVQITKVLELVVLDFWNRKVVEKEVSITALPHSLSTTNVSMDILAKGSFRAELYLKDDRLQDELVFSIVPEIKDAILASQYGMADPALRPLYRRLGFGYGASHGLLKWNYIQPNGPDEWIWDNVDRYYKAFNETFKETRQLMVWSPPKWVYEKQDKAIPFPPSLPPERQFDLNDYLKYLETIARKYPLWKYYQPWNEPWDWKPEEFVLFLKNCRETLDKINPDIKILAPTCYPRQVKWMDEFLKADGLKYTDVFAVHAYPAGGGYIPETLKILKQWATYDGNMTRPLWNTETALHPYSTMTWYRGKMPANTGSYANGVMVPECNTAEEGAERWVKMYLTQTALGTSCFFAHVAPQLRAKQPGLANLYHAETDGGRQPMLIAWAIAGNKIGTAEALGDLDVSPRLRTMLFRKGKKLIAVIWTREHENLEISNPIGAGLFRSYKKAVTEHRGVIRRIIERPEYDYELAMSKWNVKAFDMFDNAITLRKENGNTLLPISNRPVYLELNNIAPEQLETILRNGRIHGMTSFQVVTGLGQTSEGEAGILAEIVSCTPDTIKVSGECKSLSADIDLAAPSQTVTVKPGRTRTMAFPLQTLPLTLDGSPGFTCSFSDGQNQQSASISDIWLTTALYRKVITLDGNLDEWKGVPSIFIGKPAHAVERGANWKGEDDLSAKIQLAWDDDNLYIACDIVDDDFVEQRSYSGDAVELFIDLDIMGDRLNTQLDFDDRQFFLNAPQQGDWPDGRLVSLAGEVDGAVLKGIRTKKGYILEGSIPLAHFITSGFIPTHNSIIGFAPTICDKDADGWSKLIWTEQPSINLDTSKFGYLRFMQDSVTHLVTSGAMASNVVSAWIFNHPKTVTDRGLTGFDGVLTNVKVNNDKQEGMCLEFNGQSSAATFPGSRWQLDKKRFEMRFMLLPSDSNKQQLLWYEAGAPGWRYRGMLDASGHLVFELIGPDGKRRAAVISKTKVNITGRWFDVAYEWDSDKGSLTLFINGTKEDQIEMVIQPATLDLSIGGSTVDNSYFRGRIKSAQIIDLSHNGTR